MPPPLDALVMTLGFEPGPLIRAVASHSLHRKASIIILTPTFNGEKDERGERAYLEFEKICSMMLKDAEIQVARRDIELTSITTAVTQIKEIFKPLASKHIAISLSGGMRALCLATYIAYLTTQWLHTPKIEVHLEGRAQTLEIPPLHHILKPNLTPEKHSILQLLHQHGSLTAIEAAALLHRDRSTVYRHLTSLQQQGLIQPKNHHYELTSLGKIMAT